MTDPRRSQAIKAVSELLWSYVPDEAAKYKGAELVVDAVLASLPPAEPQEGEAYLGLCDVFVDMPHWGGTYCKLPVGHDGEHSAHFLPAPVRPSPDPVRAEWTDAEGTRVVIQDGRLSVYGEPSMRTDDGKRVAIGADIPPGALAASVEPKPNVTEGMVERAAAACDNYRTTIDWQPHWDGMPDSYKAMRREQMRAALVAALSEGER